jgi:hypothetical protein
MVPEGEPRYLVSNSNVASTDKCALTLASRLCHRLLRPGEPVKDGRILLLTEQGLGRAVMCVRCVPLLTRQGAPVAIASNEAESKHLQSDLVAAELDAARLHAALSDTRDPVAAFHAPDGASAELVATQRQLLTHQIEEHRAKLAGLDQQRAQKDAELATITATVNKLEALLPVLQQRVEIKQVLYIHETGSKANYLEILQSLVETQKELDVQQSRSREAEAAIAAITEERAQSVAEFRRTLSSDLVEAERKAAGLREDLIKAEQRTRLPSRRACGRGSPGGRPGH